MSIKTRKSNRSSARPRISNKMYAVCDLAVHQGQKRGAPAHHFRAVDPGPAQKGAQEGAQAGGALDPQVRQRRSDSDSGRQEVLRGGGRTGSPAGKQQQRALGAAARAQEFILITIMLILLFDPPQGPGLLPHCLCSTPAGFIAFVCLLLLLCLKDKGRLCPRTKAAAKPQVFYLWLISE